MGRGYGVAAFVVGCTLATDTAAFTCTAPSAARRAPSRAAPVSQTQTSLRSTSSSSESRAFPSYLPKEISEIVEEAALDICRDMKRVDLDLGDFSSSPVATNYVQIGAGGGEIKSGGEGAGTGSLGDFMSSMQQALSSLSGSTGGGAEASAAPEQGKQQSPILLLHGFDSSIMEFRRVLPKLEEQGAEAYALDVLGWGFTGLGSTNDYSAEAKRSHLYAFWQTVLGGRPMTLAGASLGGAMAIDFAHRYPEAVDKLVLIDGQGFIDGAGPGGALPKPLARWGIRFLGSKYLRSLANKLAYFDKTYATEDAMNVGRLHVLQEGWEEASMDYMASGGYTVSTKVSSVKCPTLVLWGRQDEILDPKKYALRFIDEMEDAALEWVEDCGHVPHLEQPDKAAQAIMAFVRGQEVGSKTPLLLEQTGQQQPWWEQQLQRLQSSNNGGATSQTARVELCSTCGGSELQTCFNCDGKGYYVSSPGDMTVQCKGCRASGDIICRTCFTGDPYDIEGIRVKTQQLRIKKQEERAVALRRELAASAAAGAAAAAVGDTAAVESSGDHATSSSHELQGVGGDDDDDDDDDDYAG